MKLSYRDRIILVVAMIVLIFVGGIFLLIKPKAADIAESKKQLEAKEKEWSEIAKKLDRIPKIETRIEEKHKEALEKASYFADEKNAYEFDQMLQELCNKNELELVGGLSVDDSKSGSLGYYYYVPEALTYPLYEYADLNGTLQKERDELLAESKELQMRSAETVIVNSVSFKCSGARENLMTLLDEVRKLDTTINIESVTISDYRFGEDLDPTPENAEKIGVADFDIVLTSYSVQEATDTALIEEDAS